MAGKKIKINFSDSVDAKKKAVKALDDFTGNEIDFNDIKRVAEALGSEHLLKKDRGKGSQERFKNKLLLDHPYLRGFFGVHIKHKGGSKIMVQRANYRKYISPVFNHILSKIKE
ncbi:MAG: hypothetical protein K8R31_13240 [Bacteroidales bacterium]|nr:hypothetical protein [Bacteroidales bacterium]